MQYLDFDLEIGPGKGRTHPVRLLRSPAGETSATMRFPFTQVALKERLKDLQIALLRSGGNRRRLLSPEEQTVQDFGQRLFDALMTGEVGQRYRACQEIAAQETMETGVRMRLHIKTPHLAALPWEFLYDQSAGDYLCLSRHTPLVRYVDLPRSIPAFNVAPPLRILGMIASPSDQDALDVEREKDRMHNALKDLGNLVELTWLEGQTWRDLQRAMRNGPWHIFHFIGHGGFDLQSDEGVIALSDENGETDLLPASSLGRLLASHHSLRLVVLNSCEGAKGGQHDIFSSTAAILTQRGVPAVLAMQYAITDQSAIELTHSFYEALADGLPVDAAVAEARTAMSVGVIHSLEWGTPVLYMRSLDGALFDVIKEGATASGSSPGLEAQAYSVGHPLQSPTTVSQYVQAKQSVGTIRVTYSNHTNHVRAAAWSPDGERIASASNDQTIHIWDAKTGRSFFSYRGHGSLLSGGPVYAVAWSPDGTRLASGGYDSKVQIWEAMTGNHFYTYSSHSRSICSVKWSPDGKLIASGNNRSTVHVWDPTTGDRVFTCPGYNGPMNNRFTVVVWSPDGTQIAFIRWKTVAVWNVRAEKEMLTYHEHTDVIKTVAWSPDGRYVASGGNDNVVRVWDASTGEDVLVYRRHTGWMNAVLSVAWSPDGRYIASGSSDKTVQLWNANTGEQSFTYRGHTKSVNSVAWSPDGTHIASASDDNTVQIWQAV